MLAPVPIGALSASPGGMAAWNFETQRHYRNGAAIGYYAVGHCFMEPTAHFASHMLRCATKQIRTRRDLLFLDSDQPWTFAINSTRISRGRWLTSMGFALLAGSLGSKAERGRSLLSGTANSFVAHRTRPMKSVFWVSSYVGKLSFHLTPRGFCLFV